ncbi:MAG: VWD domain-containing protein, partial [Bradymonadaceae bacterium]
GLAYDFQAVGEFHYARAHQGPFFDIQVRQQALGSNKCPTVTYNTALATRLGGERVGIYANRSPSILLEGQPIDIVGGFRSIGDGGLIVEVKRDETYRFVWETGETLTVKLRGSHINITRLFIPERRRGQIHGLTGTYNGSRADDLALPDGTSLGQPADWDILYGAYADSWRISQKESLFDYASGQSTQTFTDKAVPKRPATLEAIPAPQRQSARQTCRDRGVEGEQIMADCILDVYCGGAGYADEHADRREPPDSADINRPILVDEWFRIGTGDWQVTEDGRTVLQGINPFWGETNDNFPGMYVSGQTYGDTTIRGTFEVTTDRDNDWIGFVFGHQSPLEDDDPSSHDYEMFVFSWKQKNERGAKAGYALYHVDGTIQNELPVFAHIGQQAHPQTEVLATDLGSGKGWQSGTLYDFGLTYPPQLIEISIDGEIIFSVDAEETDVPFEPGRFGFYNFSQEDVRYSNFRAGPAAEKGNLPVDNFAFPLFDKTTELELNGRAIAKAGRLRLTDASTSRTAAVWYRGRPTVAKGFETTFEFRIANGKPGDGESGGEGLAFVLQNTRRGFRRPANPNGVLGYEGLNNSLAVEIDTTADGNDTSGNHIAVHTKGTAPNSA